jgi:hypothetical protein
MPIPLPIGGFYSPQQELPVQRTGYHFLELRSTQQRGNIPKWPKVWSGLAKFMPYFLLKPKHPSNSTYASN